MYKILSKTEHIVGPNQSLIFKKNEIIPPVVYDHNGENIEIISKSNIIKYTDPWRPNNTL